MNGFLNSKAAAVLVGGALLYWVVNRVLDRLGGSDAINPGSDKNLAYRGVNAVGAAASGDPSWSLGSWLYDRFNPPYDPNATYEPRKLTVRKEAGVFDWLTDNG